MMLELVKREAKYKGGSAEAGPVISCAAEYTYGAGLGQLRVDYSAETGKLVLDVGAIWANELYAIIEQVARIREAELLESGRLQLVVVAAADAETIAFREALSKPIRDVEMSVRLRQALNGATMLVKGQKVWVSYIGQVAMHTEAEFLKIHGVGRKSLKEMRIILAEMGLHFGMTQAELRGWKPPGA